MRRIHAMGMLLVVLWVAPAQGQVKIEDAVKSIEAVFEPASAKPGQTVTLKIKIELHPGWSTYPTVQPDPGAGSQVNKITFVAADSFIYVGKPIDPPNPKSKPEPAFDAEKLLYYPGSCVFEQAVVVSPLAKQGEQVSSVKFLIMVCDKENCIKKPLELKAVLKVAGDPVPVEPKYKEVVEKAMKK